MWQANEDELRNTKNEMKAMCIKIAKLEKKLRDLNEGHQLKEF